MNRKLFIRFLNQETKSRTKTINNIKLGTDDEKLKEFANRYAALSAHLYTEAVVQERKVL